MKWRTLNWDAVARRAAVLPVLLVALCGSVWAQEAKPFTFAVMTDIHLRYEVNLKSGKPMTGLETFLMAARKVGQLTGDDKPDFVMITGDLGLRAMPADMRKRNFMMPVPLHVVSGNSDPWRAELRSWFPNNFKVDGKQADYYSFVHKGVRMIVICDSADQEHIGQLSAPNITPRGQHKWIERELAKPEKRKIVFGHIPPHPEGIDDGMSLSRNDSRFFNELVRKHKPVAMFFGHQHREKQFKIGETPCYLVRPTAPNSWDVPIGFLLVRVTPKGVTTKFVEVNPDGKRGESVGSALRIENNVLRAGERYYIVHTWLANSEWSIPARSITLRSGRMAKKPCSRPTVIGSIC
ncbi:MAG: metallophosphoesterase [Kiritimatiellae bacterium]|nr:metallophosphoesterase [Kiritimatiellia bacterium]